MKEFSFTIKDPEGIHARPAGMLVKEASKFQSSITIVSGDKSGDAKRIFAVMALGVKCGDTVTIQAEGSDEEEASASMQSFFEANL